MAVDLFFTDITFDIRLMVMENEKSEKTFSGNYSRQILAVIVEFRIIYSRRKCCRRYL